MSTCWRRRPARRGRCGGSAVCSDDDTSSMVAPASSLPHDHGRRSAAAVFRLRSVVVLAVPATLADTPATVLMCPSSRSSAQMPLLLATSKLRVEADAPRVLQHRERKALLLHAGDELPLRVRRPRVRRPQHRVPLVPCGARVGGGTARVRHRRFRLQRAAPGSKDGALRGGGAHRGGSSPTRKAGPGARTP